jgi:hypothetical protein
MTAIEIELEAFESIVPGGVRRVTWLVQRDDDWVLASEVPGAEVESCDVGPKMVWLRRVRVSLSPGSLLQRIESVPMRAEPRDPLAYLFGPVAKRDRETRRSHFIVTVGGKLERVSPRRS